MKIHTIRLARFLSKATEGQQNLLEEIQAEHKGVMIPAHVKCVSNLRTIKESLERVEIEASSVVILMKGKRVGQRVVCNGVSAVGVESTVKAYANARPLSLCKLSCGCDHIKSKCNH